MECENCSVPIPDLFNYTHKVSHMHTCLHFFHTHKHMIVSLVPELQKQCFASFFPLLSPPTTHTHTCTFGTPGTGCNSSASLVVGEEVWEFSSYIFNLFKLLLYGCMYERSSWGKLFVQGQCVWHTKVPPVPTSISSPLPVHFCRMMFSHRTL